jgi:hypothetical protein
MRADPTCCCSANGDARRASKRVMIDNPEQAGCPGPHPTAIDCSLGSGRPLGEKAWDVRTAFRRGGRSGGEARRQKSERRPEGDGLDDRFDKALIRFGRWYAYDELYREITHSDFLGDMSPLGCWRRIGLQTIRSA